jgi:twinkle protein
VELNNFMDSSELNRMLLGRYQEVCTHLLPNGKVEGSHYLVGGIDGTPGKSLQITLTGSAAGRFKDFNKGDGGATPLWLWSKVKGVPFKQAVKEAKEWLGVKNDDFGIQKHKAPQWERPTEEQLKAIHQPEPNTKVMDYLTITRRLDPIVVASAKLGESACGEWVIIPYYDPGESEPFHIKKMKVNRVNGKKEIGATKGTKRGLYGKNLIDENVSEITITEGEIDALSFLSWGIPAVSMPNGVSDTSWIEVDWEWLERFERINVCPDMDEPGRLLAPELCKRLGLHRTYIPELPFKDANECLQQGVKRDDILAHLAAGKAIDLDEIKRAVDYTEEVYDYYETDWSKRGWDTPWYPTLPWRIRKAEFTILSGFSGSGKTVALNQLMLHLIQQGCKVMVSSLEIKPAMTLYNLTRCALGKRSATRDEIKSCHEWLNDALFFHDCIGTVNVDRLLSAKEYARKRHGVDVFITDSLFKCGLDPADYGAQRSFADRLTTFCNNSGAHEILVAHARKTQNGNEFGVPSKSDVAGSSDLTNAAFNVIVWWRNKLKKRKLDEAKQKNPPDNEQIAHWLDQPDGKVVIDKQRFGEGEEAEVDLWFDAHSFQFHTCRNRFVPYFTMN